MTPILLLFRITFVLALLALAACGGPTPTAAPQGTSAPSNPTAPPAGYPADVATETSVPPAYPSGSTEVPPLASPTAAATTAATTAAATAAATDTALPGSTATAGRVFITYQDFEIVPPQTTVKVGAKVTFLIKSASGSNHQPYNFTPPDKFEAPPNLVDGESYTFTFNEPGTITILCGYHQNMQAQLTIES